MLAGAKMRVTHAVPTECTVTVLLLLGVGAGLDGQHTLEDTVFTDMGNLDAKMLMGSLPEIIIEKKYSKKSLSIPSL